MTPCFASLKSFQNNCLSLGRRLSLFLPPGVPHVEPEGLPPLAFPSLPYPSCLASGEPAFFFPGNTASFAFIPQSAPSVFNVALCFMVSHSKGTHL